jgi:hypothetical protein
MTIIESLFLRKGGESEKTKIFSNMTTSIQDFLSKEADLNPDEKILIACYYEIDYWLVLTNIRIIIKQTEKKITKIPYEYLKEVSVAMVENSRKGFKSINEFKNLKIIDIGDSGKFY